MAKIDFKRLESLVKKTGKTKTHLCRVIGRGEYYLRDAKNKQIDIPENFVRAIAAELGTTPEYLTGLTDQREPATAETEALKVSADEARMIKKYRALDKHGKKLVNVVADAEAGRIAEDAEGAETEADNARYIRHYLVPAAAGSASPIEGEDYELEEVTGDVPAGADFSIDIDGDSMEPYIHDGQRVYVKRGDVAEMKDAGIFYVDGDVLCKQWCMDYVGTLHLLSANPKRERMNRHIARDSTSSCVCFGKVLLPKKLPQPVYE